MGKLLEVSLLALAIIGGFYTVHEFNTAVHDIGQQIADGGHHARNP